MGGGGGNLEWKNLDKSHERSEEISLAAGFELIPARCGQDLYVRRLDNGEDGHEVSAPT